MYLFGIKIELHWSWWAFVAIFMAGDILSFDLAGMLTTGFTLASLLGIIIIHELAHALTARHYGYQTTKIIMHLLGGAALVNMARVKPVEEFWIAAAGPASNMVMMLLAFALLIIDPVGAFWVVQNDVLSYTWLGYILLTFGWINFLIGVFNLIPAYPMDGGRMLRAWLHKKPAFATKVSHILSTSIGALFVGLGLFGGGGPFLALIGGLLIFFVWAEKNKGLKI